MVRLTTLSTFSHRYHFVISQLDVVMRSFRTESEEGASILDLPSVQKAYAALFSLPEDIFSTALNGAIERLATDLTIGKRCSGSRFLWLSMANVHWVLIWSCPIMY